MKELREEAVKLIWLSYVFSVLHTSQKFMLARWSCWYFGKECFSNQTGDFSVFFDEILKIMLSPIHLYLLRMGW